MRKNRFENIMDAFFTDNVDSKDAEKIIIYLEEQKKEKVRLQSDLDNRYRIQKNKGWFSGYRLTCGSQELFSGSLDRCEKIRNLAICCFIDGYCQSKIKGSQ